MKVNELMQFTCSDIAVIFNIINITSIIIASDLLSILYMILLLKLLQ